MAFYSYIFTANYGRFFKNLAKVAKKEHRFFPFLVVDTAWCVFRYGLALSDYLNYEIYKRNTAQRKDYVSTRTENRFYETVSPSAFKKRFTVKQNFLREFKDYTRRDCVVPGEDDFQAVCAFLDKNPQFMSKPYDGLGGQNVQKQNAADIQDRQAFFDQCVRDRIFLEQLVRQHPDMNALCPASVNTARVMTFNDHGKPEILWMGLRVGNGVNAVDNFHAQGMAVAVDQSTGKLMGNGYDKDGRVFPVHPTTGVAFDGFQLPDFEQAVELVLKGALEDNNILVIGWDVAFSDQGPVIIEANRRPGFDIVQMLDGRGRMDMIRSVLGRLPERTGKN